MKEEGDGPGAMSEPPAAMGRLPEPWFGSSAERTMAARLVAAQRRILMLDYDGTLAPFRADKMQAFPYAGVNDLLQELRTASGVRVVLVTGRQANDLPQLMKAAMDAEVWGSHGREHRSADGHYTLFAPTAEQYAALSTLEREMNAAVATGAGGHTAPEVIERKPGSVAVHWRGLNAMTARTLEAAAKDAFQRVAAEGIEELPFASGLEFRAAGYTKAFAVRSVLESAGEQDAVAYLGDDLTDEDAFRALGSRGVSLLVRPERRLSEAHFWLQPPEELLRFLRSWNLRDRPMS